MLKVDPCSTATYRGAMRWDALFADLESQLHAVASAQQESEIRERTRGEQARLTLVQRLSGQVGRQVGVSTRGGRSVTGVLTNVGAQWLALAVEGRSVVVPLPALRTVRASGRAVGQPLSGIEAKLGLGPVLRALSRDRAQVALWVTSADSGYFGVIDRVGSDFLELALIPRGDERRAAEVREVLTVPFSSIDTLESESSIE